MGVLPTGGRKSRKIELGVFPPISCAHLRKKSILFKFFIRETGNLFIIFVGFPDNIFPYSITHTNCSVLFLSRGKFLNCAFLKKQL